VSVQTTVQATFAATLVDEWVRAGVRDAVVCPGSRSTPLALALTERDELAVHVRLDERGAAFFAVGSSLASGAPTVVCTTSGTAAAELHAGVVEAHHAGVPLIVCTADRPPQLHGVGAPQTIDQRYLYAGAVGWSAEPGLPDAVGAAGWRSLAARSVIEARFGGPGPGPVHLNLAFGDPLVGSAGALPPGRTANAPWHEVRPAQAVPTPADLAAAIDRWSGRRGLLVVGAGGGSPDHVFGLAEALGWPVLADPRSGCRLAHPAVVAAADAILRDPQIRSALAPEVVVLLGAPWASKVLGSFVAEAARSGAAVVAVERWGRWFDPDRVVAEQWPVDPDAWLSGARQAALEGDRPPATDWAKRWRAAEDAAQLAIDGALDAESSARAGALSEPVVGRRLLELVPRDAIVVASSSMPVRDLEWFAPALPAPPCVVANRGANGIDGVCSTARGVATGGAPVVALVGDLAFLHDVSALVTPVGARPDSCTIVVVDNGGGGIFNFLPQAEAVSGSRFEALFGTPQEQAVGDVARGFGLSVLDAPTEGALAATLGESVGRAALSVVRVPVPGRIDNVAVHVRIEAAVAAAVRPVIIDT
jgi:2-succinyl-5-enolpyruvyl-6-hydroxy-3-cyclohexene-1-carboxylate synthase